MNYLVGWLVDHSDLTLLCKISYTSWKISECLHRCYNNVFQTVLVYLQQASGKHCGYSTTKGMVCGIYISVITVSAI